MTLLVGRKILLFGIGFYDYETAIADEFRQLGASVRVEDERPPALRGRLAPVRRKLLPVSEAEVARHRAAMLARARADGPLDYILVIKGELLDEPFLNALREAQPHARLISYQWDSMARYPALVARQALFDRVLTFDQTDSAAHPGFILRPTFYRPEILTAASAVAPSVDLCFVGWLHHDRLQQVEALRAQARALGLSAFFYLFTGLRTAVGLHLKGKGDDVRWRPLSFAHYAKHIADCRIIIDLPHPQQTGLTMRALEAVGTGKKLLTTSRDVLLYDFYRPENFSVIDADNPVIDPGFLQSPAVPLPADMAERYSLRAWALDVLGLTEPGDFLRSVPVSSDAVARSA